MGDAERRGEAGGAESLKVIFDAGNGRTDRDL